MQALLTVAKALSDENRVRALLLLQNGELCLCQIIPLLALSPSTVSKHLTILQQAGLVECRKEGRWHYYRLAAKNAPPLVRRAIQWVLRTLADEPQARQDQKRLKHVHRQKREDLSQCYRN